MTAFRLLERHRDDDLVATGPSARTARQLCTDVAALAEELGPAGSERELIVVAHDRYFFTVSLLAAWEQGYVVALPPNAQPQTVTELRKRELVATVLHDHDGMAGIDLRRLVGSPRGDAPRPRPIERGRPIVVVYTSGSSAAPVPCPKTAAQLLGEAQGLVRTFGIEPGARICATVPPHHIYGLLFGVLVPLMSGASFSRGTLLHAEPLAELMERERASVLVSVPAHLRAMTMLEPGRMPPLSRVFSSGAPLAGETSVELTARFGWTITEVLGSSETGGIAWRTQADAPWRPFPGVRVREGDEGRMLIESPLLDPGAPSPYVAGDRVRVRDDGTFVHLGRADGVVKVGSTRVSIAEIEARLMRVPGVRDAAALAVEVGGARGWETWAVVAGEGLSVAGVRSALLPWLDPVVIPRRIRIVSALPREATGKLRRDALRALFE